MTSHRNYQWVHNLITGDDKWLLYINYKHRRQWISAGETDTATPNNDRHFKKVMLRSQSDYSLKNSIKCLHHDRRSLLSVNWIGLLKNSSENKIELTICMTTRNLLLQSWTREKFLNLGWILVAHPPYSANLSPPDSHLFEILFLIIFVRKSSRMRTT